MTYLTQPDHHEDIHWEKFHEKCSPCTVPYDVIGHLETAKQDTKYILKKSGLHEAANDVKHAHVTKNGTSVMWRQHYFSKVPCVILKKVYEVYKLDFDLFGYDPPIHYAICSKN